MKAGSSNEEAQRRRFLGNLFLLSSILILVYWTCYLLYFIDLFLCFLLVSYGFSLHTWGKRQFRVCIFLYHFYLPCYPTKKPELLIFYQNKLLIFFFKKTIRGMGRKVQLEGGYKIHQKVGTGYNKEHENSNSLDKILEIQNPASNFHFVTHLA